MHHFIEKTRRKLTDWLIKDAPPREIPMCDFQRLQHEIKPCDVLLIEGRSRISSVIRSISQSPWTHAALYIGKIHDIEDIALRKIVAKHAKGFRTEQFLIEGILGHGTILSPLSNYKHDHIRICRPKGISFPDAQKVITYAINSIGTSYGVREILDLARFLLPWSILPRRWGSSLFKTSYGKSDREICSSMIAEAFESVKFPVLPHIVRDKKKGMEFIPRNPLLYTPRDFDYSPYFEIIKYPIVNIEEFSAYRNLPWTNKDIVSQDEGIVTPKNPTKDDQEKNEKNEKSDKQLTKTLARD